MERNKGFTLVELIVVVAIMAISVAIVSMSISAVSSYRAKKCANEINALLSECKVNAMSRGDGESLTLWYKDGSVYGQLTGKEAEELGSGVTLSYTKDSDAEDAEPTADIGEAKLVIDFERDTGAFKPLNGTTDYCTSIIVAGGIRIKLVPGTGHHEIG